MSWTVGMGLLGVVLGAVVTVAGTYWVSIQLDRQKEHRQLVAAIRIVAVELDANSRRIATGYRGEELRKRLTLGDWSSNKGAFAGLALENEGLWRSVAEAYEGIYQFSAGWRKDHPTPDHLNGLVVSLHQEERALTRRKAQFDRRRDASLN